MICDGLDESAHRVEDALSARQVVQTVARAFGVSLDRLEERIILFGGESWGSGISWASLTVAQRPEHLFGHMGQGKVSRQSPLPSLCPPTKHGPMRERQ